jgi:hypothetical protein
LDFKPKGIPKIISSTNAFLRQVLGSTALGHQRNSGISERMKVTMSLKSYKDVNKMEKSLDKNGKCSPSTTEKATTNLGSIGTSLNDQTLQYFLVVMMKIR